MNSRILLILFATATVSTWGCAYTNLVKPGPLGPKNVTPESNGIHRGIDLSAVSQPAVIEPQRSKKPADQFVSSPETCIKNGAAETGSLTSDGRIVIIKSRRFGGEEIAIGLVAGKVVFAIPVLDIWTGESILPDGPGNPVLPRPEAF